MKRFLSAILALSVMLISCPFALAENETEQPSGSSAVSGYVSADSGDFKLVGTDKTPTIYVDSSDYEGVVRAVGDLKDDIKTVTGVEATVTNEIETGKSAFSYLKLIVEDDHMKVYIPYDKAEEFKDCDCYTAAYDRKGTLVGVAKGTPVYDPIFLRVYVFDTVLKRPVGGKLKLLSGEI